MSHFKIFKNIQMKNKFQNSTIVFLLILIPVFVSCKKDFLEIKPKGKLIAQTTLDYDQLLNNANLLITSVGSRGGASEVVMGDEVAAVQPYFESAYLSTQRLFRWDDVIYEPNEDAQEMEFNMRSIYTYSKIINEVPNSTGGTEQEKKSIKAEALAGRAWTYFLLINYYGKPYNESTSSTDPGYPIITDADLTTTKFTRASVKEVYDFIVDDLTDAIPDLPSRLTGRLRMSKAAAEAVLGKVYMFMGKFDMAMPLLNSSIAGLSDAAIPVQLYDYNETFAPGGIFLPIGVLGPAYPSLPELNEQNVYGKQFINYWTFLNNELVITPETVALYEVSDLRLNFYSGNAFFSGPYPAGLLRRTGPQNTQIGVTVPELFLLSAECKARLNDLPGAKSDLEQLRITRMPPVDATVPNSIATDQVALVEFILEERIREFAMQGYRWFDMRRLSVDPIYKNTVNYIHTLYEEDGSTTTFTLSPERFVLRFPPKVMDQNPGMENNP